MNWLRKFLIPTSYGLPADAGLFLLRIGVGLMMMTHGWSKFESFSTKSEKFYDFMGLGPEISLGLTVFGEFFCSILLILGIGTRVVLVPLIIMGFVIVFVVHGADPYADKEHGLLFLLPYITLMLTGPGKIALDYLIFPEKRENV